MKYRTRLWLALAVMCVGAIAAGIAVWRNSSPATPTAAADVRARICESPVSMSLGSAAATVRQNGMVAGNLVLGGLTLGLRLVSQLLYLGFDFAHLYLTALRQSRSHAFAIAALVPHGIPELAAFAMLGAAGIQVAWFLLRALLGRGLPTKAEAVAWLRELPMPLAALLLAAVVEEYVTPYLMRSVFGC